MKSLQVSIMAALMLAGCSPTDVVETTVLPDGRVRIALPANNLACIQDLTIYGPSGEIWAIEGYGAPGCVRSVDFPEVPQGFKARVSAGKVGPGTFDVTGKADAYYLSGQFSIAKR